MREIEKKTSVLKNNQAKRFGTDEKRKPRLENDLKLLNTKETRSKNSNGKPNSSVIVSDLNTGTDSSEVYEDMAIHYVDDMDRSEEALTDAKVHEMVAKENGEEREEHSSDHETARGKEEESDNETVTDSIMSQGEAQDTRSDKVEHSSRAHKKSTKKHSGESYTRPTKTSSEKTNKPQSKKLHNTPKKTSKPKKVASEAVSRSIENNSKNVNGPPKPPSESSEGGDEKPIEEVKEMDVYNEAPNGAQSIDTDDETADKEENGLDEDKVNVDQKIEELEVRIEKLEEELREIAALEIALYSVVPEHGSSAHKVHTPARRLSRLYIHACKHWSPCKRATIARNTVSGLVLIAKSCGNDVSRLTFCWSNTVVLREIISQAFGGSHHSSPVGKLTESNGGGKKIEGKSSLKWKPNGGSKHMKTLGLLQVVDDWQETSTFVAALEKIESWIFSRIIESVWWQTLTPHMQYPLEDCNAVKGSGKLLGPALGDQQQGSFSIDLWKTAFQDAFQRLCPVRAGGHECGCLPVLARMVMEQCVARLDVAMFNAILRESAYDIPTDPVSDPIVDSRVLPIPAGDLSFGSGAQLKNTVGNWSRWLTDLFGMDAGDSSSEDKVNGEDDNRIGGNAESKSFHLLNALSDLLMLPKDMLIDKSIRKEVCPTLGLPLIKRILCNFAPDEFCPDAVPGAILEALNSELILERLQSDKDLISSFPCSAAPVVYSPPSSTDVAEKIADVGGQAPLGRNVSIVQRKGYTSDEELDELDSPLTSIIDKKSPSSATGNGKPMDAPQYSGATVMRYDLLREVWSV